MKNSSDTIGNRTRYLPTCSAVPQPTASPHGKIYITVSQLRNINNINGLHIPRLKVGKTFHLSNMGFFLLLWFRRNRWWSVIDQWSDFVPFTKILYKNSRPYIPEEGAPGSAVGWGTAQQVGRSRVRFPMVWLGFFIDIILLVALWPWGLLSLWQKWVQGIFPGLKAVGA